MSIDALRLYDYPASCNCYKVRLLLAHLAQRYERVNVDIFAGATLTAEFGQINPMRTTPVLAIAPDRYLPESSAILVYLAHGSRYLPEETLAVAQVIRWLVFEQTDIVPMIGGPRFRLLTGRLEPSAPDAARRRSGALEILSVLDGHLSAHEFLVADRYTIADIAMFGYTHRAHEAGLDLTPYAGVRRWLERVAQQPRFMNDLEPYGPPRRESGGRYTTSSWLLASRATTWRCRNASSAATTRSC